MKYPFEPSAQTESLMTLTIVLVAGSPVIPLTLPLHSIACPFSAERELPQEIHWRRAAHDSRGAVFLLDQCIHNAHFVPPPQSSLCPAIGAVFPAAFYLFCCSNHVSSATIIHFIKLI